MQTVGAARATDELVALSHVPVEILRWPEERERDAVLASEGRLRLLLVDPYATPPARWDPSMDWIRLPAPDEDVWRRVAALQGRQRRVPPRLDEYGLLWRDRTWVSLSRVEALVFGVLLERHGRVCSRERLARTAWPDGGATEHALNAYIKRIRRRIEPLGLAVHTVRRRGYFLELDP
jgi:hypothetical protein